MKAGTAAQDSADRSATADEGEDTLTPLRAMLAPQAFRELVEVYETTIRRSLAAIAAAARRSDLETVRQRAHDMAGMCGQIGSGRATAISRRIEAACIAGRGDYALTLVPELEPAAAETLAALARLGR
jgi:HPt (histidine-containing phosphotransfer) domain-containing protein